MIKYSTEFLQKNLIKKVDTHHKYSLWKSKNINDQVYLNYNDVVSDEGFKFFLKNLYEYGFCVITNCQTNMETVDVIANKIGYVRQSIFGGLWEFESNENMADSAYTQEELRPHTDSTYSKDAPGLQLLLCCDYDATGGESIMVDGFKIAETLKKQILIDGKFQTRTMLPLSLSYDHRIIDGAEAARFNNDLKENLGRNFAYKLAM